MLNLCFGDGVDCECINTPYLLAIYSRKNGYKPERGFRFVGGTLCFKTELFACSDARLDLLLLSLFQSTFLDDQGWMKLLQNKEAPCKGI
mmetsp:Transcript_7238/g.45231  ORF Transcript_7238/g.45231 Transcript_7238/m.45231 type:complete len:90 (-) Transcript_7238:33-302(-)